MPRKRPNEIGLLIAFVQKAPLDVVRAILDVSEQILKDRMFLDGAGTLRQAPKNEATPLGTTRSSRDKNRRKPQASEADGYPAAAERALKKLHEEAKEKV